MKEEKYDWHKAKLYIILKLFFTKLKVVVKVTNV